MNSKYKVLKFKKNKFESTDDLISVEEPLEISLKYKDHDKWLIKSLIITMRTPGHDKDLVRGFLFNEQIIKTLIIFHLLKALVIKLVNITFKIKFWLL